MSRRVRFGWKAGTPHPLMRDASGPWRRVLHDSLADPATVVADARCYFLNCVRERRPDVLLDLSGVGSEPHSLVSWAERWGLMHCDSDGPAWHGIGLLHEPWVLEHAIDTLRLWSAWPSGRGRDWSYNRADASGAWVSKRGRIPAFRHRDVPRDWFEWLVDAQVVRGATRPTLSAVATAHAVDQRAVARACLELARFLDMPSPSRSRNGS
jgi:hypothetical protein